MLVGDLVLRINAHLLPAGDIGVDRPSLDRSGPDDRNLDRDVLEVVRAGAAQRLHLRPALDLKHTGGVCVLDALVGGGVVIGDSAEIDKLAASARNQLHRTFDR